MDQTLKVVEVWRSFCCCTKWGNEKHWSHSYQVARVKVIEKDIQAVKTAEKIRKNLVEKYVIEGWQIKEKLAEMPRKPEDEKCIDLGDFKLPKEKQNPLYHVESIVEIISIYIVDSVDEIDKIGSGFPHCCKKSQNPVVMD